MRKLVFLLGMLVLGANVHAQFPSDVWHEGKVALIQGDTLSGLVKYDLETDLIQFSLDQQTIKTYTARKVLFFEIFDKTSSRYRQFYVLPYTLNGNYQAPIFFELIYEGRKITMLSREAVEYQVSNYPYAVAGTYTRLELVYTHYFLTSEGKIVKFLGKKNDLLHIMNDRSSEVKKFIKSNRIRIERRGDLVKVVAFYNSLFKDPTESVRKK